MEQYFEYIDEFSNQFWEYGREGTTISIKHGTIGTEGEITKSTYSSVEEAKAAFDRMMQEAKAKTPGVPGTNTDAYTATVITEKEAIERFQINTYIHGLRGDNTKYTLLRGNIVVDQDLDTYKFCKEGTAPTKGIIVDGNITINGVLFQPDIDYGEVLFVTGNLAAQSINKGGAEFYIKGNVTVEKTIYGYYNHGSLIVEGNTEATTIFAEDHHFTFNGDVQGLVIDTGTIEGVEVDFMTTEPLLPELIDNEYYSNSGLLNEYINGGKDIIQKKYLPHAKYSKIEFPDTPHPEPEFITDDEAVERFALKNYPPLDDIGFDIVVLFEGDVTIIGDLDYEWFEETMQQHNKEVGTALILIKGDLFVKGTISPGGDSFPFLLVIGNVHCEVLKSYDECIHITGDADITYVLDGNYNHGSIVINGITRVPYIINSNHSCKITPRGAIAINYYGDYHDFFEYDYTRKDFDRVMVAALLDENGYLNRHEFINWVKAGKSPLKKGAKPDRLIFEEELTRLVREGDSDTITELDLTEKKFKSFPAPILTLKNLKKLNLSKNQLQEVPASIAGLENLEELYLNECGLQELPAEIGELKNLRVLEVSKNFAEKLEEDRSVHVYLKLPESLGNLSNLKVLRVNYNQGFGFPKTITKLKDLEELAAYNCSDAAPIDFPEEMTQLTGLKRLIISSNSFKTIPASFLNLQNLEELDLNASLCYLSALPDLSTLTKLRVLKANGLINYTTRPKPHQSLLRSFFGITGLEELSIDRHGESKDIFKDAEFRELLGNLAYDPERQAEIKACFQPQKEKNPFYGTIWEGYSRKNLTAQHLEGIGNLKNLKVLDLSFNGLEHLPGEIYTLQHLEKVNLKYNENLAIEDLKRLYETFPKARINGKKIRTRVDIDDENFKKINDLNKHGNLVMRQQNYAQAIETFEEAISLCTPDKKYSDYDELYAHYGVAYSLGQWIPKQPAGKEKDAMIEKLKRVAKKALDELIPADGSIWHYTEEGAFQEECIRIMGNALAWNLYENTTDKAVLEEALVYASRAAQYIDGSQHHFILDTQVRVLLKLGRQEEAYPIVARTLAHHPAFADFQDLKQDNDYLQWVAMQ